MKHNTTATSQSSIVSAPELLPKLQQNTSEHPALSRMRAKMMQASGVQAITAYDRMHHRHNRS
ncbi:YhhA family cyclophane-containing RiPP [Mucilaginibacter ginsenosidivorans]|uniref:YhhA family cyclophane-containing RiPP n=1 Tax=Mucilaginibacter ginsenosidivorans TaxID=398053 RepID=UPI0035EAF899